MIRFSVNRAGTILALALHFGALGVAVAGSIPRPERPVEVVTAADLAACKSLLAELFARGGDR